MVQRFGARKVITGGLTFALAGMIGFALITPATPVWVLVLIGLVFGFGLGNTIAPSTTRMTLATPPERSGSGSAVQNTVRQVAAVFGVAILSSVVGTVYSNNMSPLLEGKPLPPEALQAATDSIGGTNEVADRLAASGSVPPAVVEQLRQAANDSFMPALHTAALVSAGLLVIAIAVILWRLPAKAEAVAWAGSGPGSAPTGNQDAESRVHSVDEAGNELADIDSTPLEHAPVDQAPLEFARVGRHAAPEPDDDGAIATAIPASVGRHAAAAPGGVEPTQRA
jgi:hypothetical protein